MRMGKTMPIPRHINVYLAARYTRKLFLREVVKPVLEGAGITVTSSWIDEPRVDERLIDTLKMMNPPIKDLMRMREISLIDRREIFRSDLLIMISGDGGAGRHFECGFACALRKPVIIVGNPECIFYHGPGIECIPGGNDDVLPEIILDAVVGFHESI